MRQIWLLFVLLLASGTAYGQTTVTGHVKLPDTSAPANAKVCFTLLNYKPNVPKVVGTGELLSTTNYCIVPAADGSYSTTLYGNSVITPPTTNWRVDFLFNGIQVSSATYLINHSPFNLDTEIPLSSSTPAGPNQLILNVFPFTQLTPATTWTIPHNFNDPNTIALVSGLNGNDIYADTKNCRTDANNCIVTFVAPTSGFAIAMHAAQISIASTQPNAIVANPIGAQTTNGQPLTIGGPLTINSLNGEAWLATGGSVASAIALQSSGGTIRIPAGTYSIPATLSLVSNLDIECAPNNATVLQASAALSGPLFLASGVNHATIRGCVLDGNFPANPNSNDLIQSINSSHIVIDSNHLKNTLGNGIYLRSGSSWIEITRNEIDHLGPALPSLGTAITSDNNATAAVTHVKITENKIHDGSLGVYVQPAVAGTTTYDWEVAHNRVYANASDGMAIFSNNSASVGKATGLRFVDNDSECNGWPANGTGFDPFCAAGFRQTGAVASSSGSGLDLNSANMEGIVVVGNTLSHNFFEGLDVTPQTVTIVNTSGTTVTYVSGDPFNTNWLPNQGIQIGGTNYLIASVAGATSTITLTGSAGTQTGVTLIGVGIVDPSSATAVVSGNTACDNGHGNGATSGQGFADIAYKVSYSSNFACRNNAPGFVSNKSSFITHSGDVAIGNNLSGASNGNFLASTSLNPSYYGVVTSGNAYGLVWDSQTTNAFASSPNISGSTGAVNNLGVGGSYEVGSNRFGALTFNTGGSYGLNGSAGGGSFGAILPAVGTPGSPVTLSPLVTQDCGTTTTCSATSISSTVRMVKGTVTLNGATPGVATITGIPAFTSSTSYSCTVTTKSTVANGKKCTNVSSSSITITGVTGDSDVVDYVLVGN